jgi:hypothetical protein
MEDLIRLYNNSQSRLERANLKSHMEAMIEDLAIETYPNEYETSLYYDEDYIDFINTKREAFGKGYLSAIEKLLID